MYLDKFKILTFSKRHEAVETHCGMKSVLLNNVSSSDYPPWRQSLATNQGRQPLLYLPGKQPVLPIKGINLNISTGHKKEQLPKEETIGIHQGEKSHLPS